jgi:hypothetical protein
MERITFSMRIPAKIHTDDGAKCATFDARSWFATASMERIVELAQAGWRSRREATSIARLAQFENPEMADVLQYVMFLRHGGLDGSCTCTVDRVAALEWLAYHRPDVFARVRAPKRVA